MADSKNKIYKFKTTHLQIAGVLFLILLAACLLWFNNSTSMQADPAILGEVYFKGEYRIEDGEWQQIVEGEHIPTPKGYVTLRGKFHERTPFGEEVGVYVWPLPIAFYADHINLTFREGENEPITLESEDAQYGDSMCGESWFAFAFESEGTETIEITVHNPHSYGNETAIDEMLENVAIWDNSMGFEKGVLNSGEPQRNMGMLLMLVSVVFLGIALFLSLIHVKSSKISWLLGLVVLFAGLYLIYSAKGVSFWSESIVSNTTILGASMMFYMLFLSMTIIYLFRETAKIGGITVLALAVADAIFFILPLATNLLFYDLWIVWIAVQLAVNTVLSVCLIKEFFASKTNIKWLHVGGFLPLVAFAIDVVGTGLGIWKGGIASQYVFTVLFVAAITMVLKFIPNNINAATKAKELEMEKIVLKAELAESRISTMMSQIRPHFIYNTLGSIEQLCDIDPPKAGELVHDFARYLRGNFGELDNPKPISMSQEMQHVHHYVSIENVRFPDMTFSFEMNSDDFRIPALTIQPIVENAIKHGLMKLQKGGTIRVVSYETDDHYCVSVEDNGVGFDTTVLLDERKHVGLRNIRERLTAMVNGTLEIQSTVGVGTYVLIKIPKETEK